MSDSAEAVVLEDDAPESEAAAPAAPVSRRTPTMLAAIAREITPRTIVRLGFLTFFLWTLLRLWQFYQWALGNGDWVPRPEAPGGLVPLGGLMSLFAWLRGAPFDPVMPAAVVILIAAALLSLLMKRGFCGWICPVGTAVSFFGWVGRKIFGRQFHVPKILDALLRLPKYLIAAYLIGWLVRLPVEVATQFQMLPYYATSDLKILYGILNPAWGYWALGGFVAVTSLFYGNTWCRYLCPLGAVYSAIGAGSASTIRRDPSLCIDCNKCTAACTARIDVAKAKTVRSPECDGCIDCVRACPKSGALTTRFFGISAPWQFWPVMIVVTWLLIWSVALATGHWRHGLPDETIAQYMQTMKLSHDWGQE